MGGVAANRQTATPSRPGTGSGCGVDELDRTSQPDGAVTVNRKWAFRSGCSNVVNTRRASGISKCV